MNKVLGINVCFWETAHLPLPKPNIIKHLPLALGKMLGLGRGRWAVFQKQKGGGGGIHVNASSQYMMEKPLSLERQQ